MRSDTRFLKSLLPAGLVLLAGCGAQEALQVGAVLPLTGASSVYGESVKKGVELAFEHVQQDTTYKYTFELDVRDSGSDPDQAATLGAELFESTIGVIGGVTSSEALAMVPAANDTARLFMAPSASTNKLSRAGRTVFRLFTNALAESSVMATFADDTLNSRTATIVKQIGPPADDFAEGFAAGFENLGGEITEIIEIDSTTNLDEVVALVVETDADAVYLALEGSYLPQLITALRAAGVGGGDTGEQKWILSTSSFSSAALISQAGDAAQDVYITQSVFDPSSEDGTMAAFAEAYRAKYGEEPDIYAGHGYDAMILLAESTRVIINTLPSELLKGIRSIENLPGATALELKFDEEGDAQKFPRIHWIDKGGPRDFQKAMTERREAMEKEMDDLRREALRLRQGAARDN